MAKQRNLDLDQLSDDELLEMRMCDLELALEGTILEKRVDRLYDELQSRGILFRPHCWLSDEWFSPDGIPGIAIPFYLAHRRLKRLERKQLLDVEGGTERWCMRILRHEAGHAIDTAYRLRRRRTYRDVFGKVSQPYPEYYQPKPYSKSYVMHLDMWYAQSHPVEDFAETFAVWLRPGSRWRTRYKGWPALKKLEYVDGLMKEVAATKPLTVSRAHLDRLHTLRKTLGHHYQMKRDHYGYDYPNFYDRDLRRLFAERSDAPKSPSAAAFLNRIRPEIRKVVATWTGEYQYTIDQVITEMIQRCRELQLKVNGPEAQIKRDAMVLITIQTMNHLHEGHHRVAL